MKRIDRRRFLVTSGSAAVLGLAGSAQPRAESRPPVEPFRMALPIPPVLSPVRSDSAADYYEIVQREAAAEIVPGMRTRIWGYNGIFPGPTIEARCGRPIVVTHTNRLDRPTVVHLHGVTRPESDGFPTDTLAPGETRSMRYDNTGQPATLWSRSQLAGRGTNLYMANSKMLRRLATRHAQVRLVVLVGHANRPADIVRAVVIARVVSVVFENHQIESPEFELSVARRQPQRKRSAVVERAVYDLRDDGRRSDGDRGGAPGRFLRCAAPDPNVPSDSWCSPRELIRRMPVTQELLVTNQGTRVQGENNRRPM